MSQQPFMQQQQSQHHHHHPQNLVTPTQKPLFSLFDDPIVPNPPAALPTPVAHQNGGGGLRSIVGGAGGGGGSSSITGGGGNGGASNGTSVGAASTTGSSNIWTYDMDFFDRSKIPSDFDFPNIFNNKLTLNDQPSPPRKQFVEREVQTDESSFGGGGAGSVCASCAQKIAK